MEAEIVWLDQALSDIHEILSYISLDNSKAADAYIDALVEATLRLSSFPESGRRYNSIFRTISFRNHVIFYRFEAERQIVSITTIIDARRDIEATLEHKQIY